MYLGSKYFLENIQAFFKISMCTNAITNSVSYLEGTNKTVAQRNMDKQQPSFHCIERGLNAKYNRNTCY
jgi:hypothetical protein